MLEKAKAKGNALDRGSKLASHRKMADFQRTLNGKPKLRNQTKVKDRVQQEIGAKELTPKWSDIEWKTTRLRVRNLRQRIYRATREGQWNRVRSLTKLMIRSHSNLLLSVRRVTQENQGKQTAGVDNQTVLTPEDKVKLAKEMSEYSLWKVRPTKRVHIPKANGKTRPLGIPTIKDRVAQAVIKNALEPSWEARFEPTSYGFRPGRSTQDAIMHIWMRCNAKTGDTWVLDADIKGAFDNISHKYILNAIGNVPGRELVKQWLKAGYVESNKLFPTESGTPQGGIISPLLANIALDGLGEMLGKYTKVIKYPPTDKNPKGSKYKMQTYGYSRYADDFVVTAKSREELESIKPTISEWLAQRGLELNVEKTQITRVEDAFNFLGYTYTLKKGKCLTIPQKDKVKLFLKKIREWLKSNPSHSQETVINFLNPIIRGWGNYYRHGASSKVFQKVDHLIWSYIWKWSLKRHPNKGKGWVKKRYFRTYKGRDWQFSTTYTDHRGQSKTITLHKLSDIPIERHVKVKDNASPDDPTLREYWHSRQTKQGKIWWDKGSKYRKIAENQNWKCPICGEHLNNGEALHLHHDVQVANGGTNDVINLIHVHKPCHRKMHGRKTQKTQEFGAG